VEAVKLKEEQELKALPAYELLVLLEEKKPREQKKPKQKKPKKQNANKQQPSIPTNEPSKTDPEPSEPQHVSKPDESPKSPFLDIFTP
jgi:hypothetical protein